MKHAARLIIFVAFTFLLGCSARNHATLSQVIIGKWNVFDPDMSVNDRDPLEYQFSQDGSIICMNPEDNDKLRKISGKYEIIGKTIINIMFPGKPQFVVNVTYYDENDIRGKSVHGESAEFVKLR